MVASAPRAAPDVLGEWLSSLLDEARCRVDTIPLADSAEWRFEDGAIVHRSRGFFRVIGLQCRDDDAALFIDQRTVGTLGFLIRDHELLVHAKIEPGNVGLIQLAPTCQATESNALRMHGGAAPPFIDAFPRGAALYDVDQSEQGTRFLGKRNRNVLAAARRYLPLPPTHRWMPADEVLELTRLDYTVNTDARSVLVCAPWYRLVGRVPFSRFRGGFGAELMVSAHWSSRSLERVKASILAMRAAAPDPVIVPLHDVSPNGVRVRQIRVSVRGREVPSWDQPILDSSSEGKVILACGRIDGVLHFLFRARPEPGLRNKVELTPTVVVEPGGHAAAGVDGVVVAEVRQSEEGGRFYRDTNLYQIVDVGEASDAEHWLTLADVRQLLDEPGWLTNEARSALSLLLPWL
ncbi:MAG TPA: NDP-hexose 2,3-dehydratase family protein [Thermoanaerobaculia bacterium]|nr:NDP-hexose 2,3-dehydratase family protein [Thermoanaerobaculia bacterium]